MVAGRVYRTGGGRVLVQSVEQTTPSDISAKAAKAAGYRSLDELADYIGVEPTQRDPERHLYIVRFELSAEPDPREQLAADDKLSTDDIAEITKRLDRYDNASSHGAWTRPTLELIAKHPGRRAPDMAELVDRDTQPFKLDVRKLKNMGLTHSLRIGYELSPRGEAYLKRVR